MDSSSEPEHRDWKIRGLLESSVDSTSASLGILSSFKKSPDYGTTELRNIVTPPSHAHHRGAVPSDKYREKDDVDRHGNCYHGHQSSAHVEIHVETGKSVRFSQSVPLYGRHEDIGGGVRESGDVEGGRVEGRKRHSSAGEVSPEKRRWREAVPLRGDGLGNVIRNGSGEGREGREGGDGEVGGGERGGEEEVDRGGREVRTQRARRQRKRKKDDRQHLLEDSGSPSPPPPHHRYRRKRSSAKHSEVSPSNRKEVTRDRLEDVMEGSQEDEGHAEKVNENVV